MLPVQERVSLFSAARVLLSIPPTQFVEEISRYVPQSEIEDSRIAVPNCLRKKLNFNTSKKKKKRSSIIYKVPAPKSQRQVKQKWARLLRKNSLNYENL
jgi:hypothetical protein